MLYLQLCVDKTLSTRNLLPANSFKLIKVFEWLIETSKKDNDAFQSTSWSQSHRDAVYL